MRNHAKVVVVGGGVIGCSVLYHLCKGGWTDVVLLERSELTSGSSWHAAGSFHTVNGNNNIAKLQKYTIELYKELEKESGQNISVHLTGGIMLAATEARFDWLKSIHAKGKYSGLDSEVISAEEAHRRMPLLDPDKFVGAVYDECEGHLDPSGATYAYAKAAKKLGAEVHTNTKVEEIIPIAGGGWRVVTASGDIITENVVNAAGLWAREVGKMSGINLPVLAMEHQYLITEDMPEVIEINETTGKEVIHVVDFDGEIYLRQERKGMLMGTYEKACVPWSPVSTPWDFGHELLEPDIDKISPELEVGFTHFPSFANTGIKQIIHGPFTFAPDGNPLVGPLSGMPGMWSACGVMAGFAQGGGVGLALANWMIDGDPGFDIFAMDIARFGDFATPGYTRIKVPENYSRRFSIRFPNEELPAARPHKTTPIYSELKNHGAQFGAVYGLEVPLWFAPAGVSDEFSLRRSTDFKHIAAEVAAVRNNVGLIETSGFSKFMISGADARSWLDYLLTCKLPKAGRITLAPMLNPKGNIIGDFTLGNLGDGRWLLVGSGAAEDFYMRWFLEHKTDNHKVNIESIGLGLSGLAIAGPRSRDVLASICDFDVSNKAFSFLSLKQDFVGGVPVIMDRVSYTGDLGYEFWVKPEYQLSLFNSLMEARKEYGVKLFGSRALNSLRLEKNYGSWGADYRPIYNPFECELGRFVALDKTSDFIGKAAALEAFASGGGKLRIRAFVVDATDSDIIGDEPIYYKDKVCGWMTSGGFAHGSGVSVGIGYIPNEFSEYENGWSTDILGRRVSAKLLLEPLFDPSGTKMRS